jgi:hypothetical protein
MDLAGYIIFLVLAYLVTVHVGWVFFKRGRVYILFLMKGDEAYTDAINRILLIGYYLFNLGYAALMLSCWEPVNSFENLVSHTCHMLGRLIITLAIMHYANMGVIFFLSKRHKKSIKPSIYEN